MDKNEDRQQEEVSQIPSKEVPALFLPVAQEYGEVLKDLLATLEKSREYSLSLIRNDIKSLFSNKRMLYHIMYLVQISHDMAKIGLVSYFSGDYLNRKLALLENIVLTMQSKMKDLPASADVKKLKTISKQMTEMDSLIKNLQDLANQSEKEKIETFKKLDKARQQVLRDSVV